MKRATLLVVFVVLTGGCNAPGGVEVTPESTVTPVSVPPTGTVATPTETPDPRECLGPRPANPKQAAIATPETPVPLPTSGDGINGSSLVVFHSQQLSSVGFRLSISPGTEVRSLPDAAAFSYVGVALETNATWAYAVAGRLYTLRTGFERLLFQNRSYRAHSPLRNRYSRILTGEPWLDDRVGRFDYDVVDRRTWNETQVRVLENRKNGPFVIETENSRNAVEFINVTVYVDRRGVIRRVRYVRDIYFSEGSTEPDLTRTQVFTVHDIGPVKIYRPDEFCVSSFDVIRTTDSNRSVASATTDTGGR